MPLIYKAIHASCRTINSSNLLLSRLVTPSKFCCLRPWEFAASTLPNKPNLFHFLWLGSEGLCRFIQVLIKKDYLMRLTFDFRQPRFHHEPLRVHQPAPPPRSLRRHSRRNHLGHQKISYACSSLLRSAQDQTVCRNVSIALLIRAQHPPNSACSAMTKK
jgi:hypothetical protein